MALTLIWRTRTLSDVMDERTEGHVRLSVAMTTLILTFALGCASTNINSVSHSI
jgi:hypothetical protein